MRGGSVARAGLVFRSDYRHPCDALYNEPGPCARCGRPLVRCGSARRYCGSACRRRIARLPLDERAKLRAATLAGACVGCGAMLSPERYRCPRARNAWLRRWRRAAGGELRFGAEGFEWLAERLGCEATDERLPEVALRLAEAGRLAVLVGPNGKVRGLAKPKRVRA